MNVTDRRREERRPPQLHELRVEQTQQCTVAPMKRTIPRPASEPQAAYPPPVGQLDA
jgi:hypothetical protein